MKILLTVFLLSVISFSQSSGQKKILIVATSADYRIDKPDDHTWGAYTPEIIYFYSRMIQSGYAADQIDILSPKGGKIPLAFPLRYPKRFPLSDTQKQIFIQKLNNALSPADIVTDRYGVIYYSGGFSCLVDYPDNKAIAGIAADIYRNGGIIAAVCDGVAGLLPVCIHDQNLLAGKIIATNKNLENKLKEKGAIISKQPVAHDKRVITAKGVKPVWVANEILATLLSNSTPD